MCVLLFAWACVLWLALLKCGRTQHQLLRTEPQIAAFLVHCRIVTWLANIVQFHIAWVIVCNFYNCWGCVWNKHKTPWKKGEVWNKASHGLSHMDAIFYTSCSSQPVSNPNECNSAESLGAKWSRLVPSKRRAVEPQKSSKSTNLRLRQADQTQKHVERCGTQELRFVLVYSERTQFEEVARECKRLIVKGSLQNSIRHRRPSTRHHKTRLTKKVQRREPHAAARCWYLPFRISFKDNHWMARNDLTHRTRASGFGDFGLKHAQSCTTFARLLRIHCWYLLKRIKWY